MSEANAPFDRPNLPDAAAAPDWENPFAALVEEANWEDGAENPLFEQEASQPERASASRVDPIAKVNSAANPSAAVARPSLPDPMAAIAAWSENAIHSTESTEITDLISLIQELNQCNSILLDRVSQLEESLESSQIALQAEVGRSQDYQSIASQPSEDLTSTQATSAQENSAQENSTQEQIISLFNQLEFAHQTHQRQQILIETLTGQLETSQERVAQLEREAALLQQHYSDRSQLLAQAEGTNRDLQARLHRQQRYTLQFKVALEKCLEVPAPQYELGELVPAIGEQSFLPRTQRIQPWVAADEIATPRAAWMKLHSFGLEELDQPVSAQSAPSESAPSEPASLEPVNQAEETNLRLPVIQLPVAEKAKPSGAASAIGSESIGSEPAVSYDLAAKPSLAEPVSFVEPAILAEAALMQQIDVAMQPLAVQLTDAIRAGIELPAEPTPELSVELPAAPPTEALADFPVQSSAPANPSVPPVAKLVEPDADAEDDLWQDLARLIEISTEDVVKASLAGDFTAFEAIDFEAIQAQSDQMPMTQLEAASAPQSLDSDKDLSLEPIQPEPIQSEPVNLPANTHSSPQPDTPPNPQTDSFIPALTYSSSPSPVIYPLRPAKKQRSPGAIDLPCFARQDANPGMA